MSVAGKVPELSWLIPTGLILEADGTVDAAVQFVD